MTTSDIAATCGDDVLQVVAKAQIRDLLERYCRAIDRQLWDQIRDCYEEGARHHHGMFVGSAQDFVDYVGPHFTSMIGTQHVLTNVNVTLSGDQARSEAYAIAFHRMPSSRGGETDQTVWYRYLDSLTWRSGRGWRIRERRVVYDWSRIDPVGRQWSFGDDYLRGASGAADASVGHLGELE